MDAAFSRVSFGIVSRADRNGSAVKASAYNLCGRLQHGGVRYDFRRKSTEHQAHAVLLPPGAPPHFADPGTLWRAAEAAEKRHDAQTARQILLSIPREIAAADRLNFASAVVAPWVADGAAAQVDIHCPAAADGGEQPHAHILLTLRRVTDKGFAKAKAREWNTTFREEGGRAERRRIEERGNTWMAAHGIAARMDMRSLSDRGDDRVPEPTAPRAEWEKWKRDACDPDLTPATVVDVLRHRQRRREMIVAEAKVTEAAAQVATLEREVAADQERRRVQAQGPWMVRQGGYDDLDEAAQEAARRAYKRWHETNPAAARRHGLHDYVVYVQDRQGGRERERDTVGEVSGPGSPVDPHHRRRRLSHLEALLADRYQAPQHLLPHVRHVATDPGRGLAVLHLHDGTRLVDHGDRLEYQGPVTRQGAEAAAAAAAAAGWTRVTVKGSAEFRTAVSMACALREPPVETDYKLGSRAQAHVDDVLRRRAEARSRQQTPEGTDTVASVGPGNRTQDMRAIALTRLQAAERAASPAELPGMRAVTAAAVAGDSDTIAAAAVGDMAAAAKAAAAHRDQIAADRATAAAMRRAPTTPPRRPGM